MTESAQRPVGLIGWGQMGGAVGARLVSCGQPVIAYDRDPDARSAAAKAGATVVSTSADVTASTEMFITLLPDDRVVEAVYAEGIRDHIRDGQIWLEMTSSFPSSTAALAREVAESGVAFVDAPVTGGVGKAVTGELTIIAAGTAAALDRARPIFEHVSSRICHVSDEPGGGDLVKTVNNMLSAANLAIAGEGLRLAEAGGIDPEVLLDVLNNGTGQSNATSWKIPTYVLPQRFDSGFALGQYAKDLRIAMRACSDMGIELGISSHVDALWQRLAEAGHAADDHTYAVELVRRGS